MTLSAEATRIQAEYARRARALPADFYSWATPVNLFFHQQIARECIRGLAHSSLYPLNGRRIADVGCGNGTWLLEYVQWGADPNQMAGIDLSADRLTTANLRLPGADLRAGDAGSLPWPGESFDVVSQHMLFTSVLDPNLKQAIAREMLRVLKPGGVVLWYDFLFDNPRNAQVRGIRKDEIASLFPECERRLTRLTLAPPIARRLVPISWLLALGLEKIPFLCTHYLGIFRKPTEPPFARTPAKL